MERLLQRLNDARAAGSVASISLDDLPSGVDGAYAAAMAQISEVAAWKIGGANPWSRKLFANTEIFFGPLAENEVHHATDTVSLGGLVAPLAEPEVMLRVSGAPGSLSFSDMALGFEIPASVLPEDCKVTLLGQIADRAGAGLLWVSDPKPLDAEALTAPFVSVFRQNEGEEVVGGGTNVVGGPLGAAQTFLDLAVLYDMPVQPGQWIASGGLTPAVAVQPGDVLRVRALGRTAKLAFT